jgi:hypothetical protein
MPRELETARKRVRELEEVAEKPARENATA